MGTTRNNYIGKIDTSNDIHKMKVTIQDTPDDIQGKMSKTYMPDLQWYMDKINCLIFHTSIALVRALGVMYQTTILLRVTAAYNYKLYVV